MTPGYYILYRTPVTFSGPLRGEDSKAGELTALGLVSCPGHKTTLGHRGYKCTLTTECTVILNDQVTDLQAILELYFFSLPTESD